MRLALLVLAALAACGDNEADDRPPLGAIEARCQGDPGRPRILVYTRENLWNHESNPIAEQTLLGMCDSEGFNVVATDDGRVFEDGHLDEIDVVVFAVTSGTVLEASQEAALQRWYAEGHGIVGIHSASATQLDTDFFIHALGGQFLGHADRVVATLELADPSSPLVDGYDARTSRLDEWYTFTSHPEEDPATHVLLTLDESTLPGDYPSTLLMGFHPIAWTHESFGGRAFYTALGHFPSTYTEAPFLRSLVRGIEWAAGER